MLIGRDDSNDVITLGMCFFNVCLHSCSFLLHADWRKSDSSVNRKSQWNWRWNSNSRETSSEALLPFPTRRACSQTTVEPRLTTTPLIRPPCYCDHFFVARTKAHSFSYVKIPLIQPPRYYDQRPPLGVLSRYFLYKITPLIRPVKMLGGAAE